MIPRAEITLLVAQQAETLDYSSSEMLSAIVVMSAMTCLVSPWIIERLLRRRPRAQTAR